MRLKPEEISNIVDNVLKNLKKRNLITFKADESLVKQKMIDIFNDNFLEEEKLNEEAEEILKKFQKQIDSGEIDYRKMLQKVKTQLAKDKGFIL